MNHHYSIEETRVLIMYVQWSMFNGHWCCGYFPQFSSISCPAYREWNLLPQNDLKLAKLVVEDRILFGVQGFGNADETIKVVA